MSQSTRHRSPKRVKAFVPKLKFYIGETTYTKEEHDRLVDELGRPLTVHEVHSHYPSEDGLVRLTDGIRT